MALSQEDVSAACKEPDASTKEFIFQQTMFRVKDPKVSLDFYTRILGMRLLQKFDFPEMKFTLYFLGFEKPENIPTDEKEKTIHCFKQKATLELTQLLKRIDVPSMKFTVYFMGYDLPENIPTDESERSLYCFKQKATLELTHNWGTEKEDMKYHNGNSEPRGFGHIGLSVPDVYKACERFEQLGVKFIKTPDGGKMKGLAFIQDPDGYWIEILSPNNMVSI